MCVPSLQAEVMWALIEVYEEQPEDYARNSIRGSARYRLALPVGADKLHSHMWPRPLRLTQGRFSRGVCSLVGRWLGGQMLSIVQTVAVPTGLPNAGGPSSCRSPMDQGHAGVPRPSLAEA